MLLNKTAGDIGKAFIESNTYKAAADKVMNASVMLLGAGNQFFVGSAIILGAGKEVGFSNGKWSTTDKQFTVLVSALHNLFVNADKQNKIPPLNGSTITWKQAYADTFAKDVTIKYGNGASNMDWGKKPEASAAIKHVVPIFQSNLGAEGKMITIPANKSGDGKQFQLVNLGGKTTPDGSSTGGANDGITPVTGQEAASWGYDVVLLLSTDASLYQYATTQNKCDYMAGVNLQKLSESVVNSWSPNARKTITPVMRRDYRLVQVGYGNTQDTDVPVKNGVGKTTRPQRPPAGATYQKLQYKRCLPLAAATADSFYLNTEHKLPDTTTLVIDYSGGLFLNCKDGNDSTFSGDSGGPLLAFPAAGGALAYLAGVNSGAGMALSDGTARDNSVWEYDNNVVTSMGYFYENLYDLRFQKV